MTDFDDYMSRLGTDPEPPSVEAMFALHRAHVERIPYETTWIFLGERWDIDVSSSVGRIAGQGRGGYCFHVNGAMAALLDHLGYDVTLHVGGVHGSDGPDAASMTNHLVVNVAGLPTADNPDGHWYLDAGLGDALHEPLPLLAGVYRQGPLAFGLESTPGDVGDWHFTHDPRGSFSGMSFRSLPATIDGFTERHLFLSTDPGSSFAGTPTVQRRDAGGVDILRGLTLSRLESNQATPRRVVTNRAEWFDVLAGVFGLTLGGVDEAGRDKLWASAITAHQAWEQSQDSEQAERP